jgi:hypothetical protein
MARFGSLILNKGNWNGNQIMTDTAYFNDMVNTSQNLNKSYGYLWWLNGKPSFMIPMLQTVFPGFVCPNAPSDMYAAIGKGGQFLNIVPSQNLVWLRMGDEPTSSLVPFLLNDQIWEYLNNLTCSTSGLTKEVTDNMDIVLFPNPTNKEINISCKKGILGSILIYNNIGTKLFEETSNETSLTIDISNFGKGIYFINQLETGKSLRFLKGD